MVPRKTFLLPDIEYSVAFSMNAAAWRDLHASRVHRNGVTVGDEHHYTVWPPSTTIACPTTKEAASEHSHRTAAAISSGFPILPMGSCEIIRWRPSGVSPVTRSIIWVSMIPGHTALTRMFACA